MLYLDQVLVFRFSLVNLVKTKIYVPKLQINIKKNSLLHLQK